MTALAFALLATLPLAAAGWLAGALADRLTPSAGLRERVWTLAFTLPLLAAVIPVVALLFPRAASSVPDLASLEVKALATVMTPHQAVWPAAPSLDIPWDSAPTHGPALLMVLAAVGALVRLVGLARRHRVLAAASGAASPLARDDLTGMLAKRARSMNLPAPPTAVSERVSTPVLVGLRRPRILIPTALADMPIAQLDLICAHELAHAKRGDNIRLLAEELLLALLWFSPIQAAVHQRLTVAREEARDALALTGAATADRRRYAETLVQILRLGTGPGLKTAFIGTDRKGAAMRLKAILSPRPTVATHRLLISGLAALLLMGASAGSLAIAAQVRPSASARAPDFGVTISADKVVQRADGVWRYQGEVRLKIPADLDALVYVDDFPTPVDFARRSIAAGRLESVDLGWTQIDGDKKLVIYMVPLAQEERALKREINASWNLRPFAAARAGVMQGIDRKPSWVLQSAKYRNADALDYQRFCAEEGYGSKGACAGSIFGLQIGGAGKAAGACIPADIDDLELVERTKVTIKAARPAKGDPKRLMFLDALRQTFPCPA